MAIQKGGSQILVLDGTLTQAEALGALRAASEAARNARQEALKKCETKEQVYKILSDCLECRLAYARALKGSLEFTGPLFEQNAKALEDAAKEIDKKSKQLKTAAEAADMLADAVRLARALSLAFG